jgi:hypothetical protein
MFHAREIADQKGQVAIRRIWRAYEWQLQSASISYSPRHIFLRVGRLLSRINRSGNSA